MRPGRKFRIFSVLGMKSSLYFLLLSLPATKSLVQKESAFMKRYSHLYPESEILKLEGAIFELKLHISIVQGIS